MGKIKLIGLDMDGTVLDSRKRISEENKDAFALCREKGIQLVPVTGRPYSGLYDEYVRGIGCEYSIHTNGAVVMDLKNSRQIIHHGIDIETAKRVVDILEGFNCYYELFYRHYGYLNREDYEAELNKYSGTPLYEYIRRTRRVTEDQRGLLSSIDCCDNLYVTAENTLVREKICDAIRGVDGIFFTCSGSNDVEIGGNCSKGGTLIELGKYLGIEKAEIMAIGDSNNDVSMLSAAGVAVAMGNACDEVKAAADYITKACGESGVAFAIRKFVK